MKETAFNIAKSTLFKATEKIIPQKIHAIMALVGSLSMSTIAGCAAQDIQPQTAC
ncbi:hypothetical protein GF340_01435, partial [Candidatus Peregrinibacteria bacterium]|nr:hypothetical protein [Candidatus Peregrinibacteria bacterium]